MNSGGRLEYIILFAVSFIAAIWFFVGYSTQDPRSAARVSFNQKEVELRAVDKLSELGFAITNYTIKDVSFQSNGNLLDSLQQYLGREKAISMLKDSTQANIKPYYWEVEFERSKNNNKVDEQYSPLEGINRQALQLRIGSDGHFMGLINLADHLPQKQVRRSALAAVFARPDSLGKPVMEAISDSLLGRLLYFDMQKPTGNAANFSRKPEADIEANFKRGIPYRHSPNDAQALADYYVSTSGWNISSFRRDTVFIKRINNVNAANVRYVSTKAIWGQYVQIDVVVAPTGALFHMQATYNHAGGNGQNQDIVWGTVYVALIFLLGLAGLLIFFFRMRARAIDTQSALIIAVIMGLIVPIYIFLANVDEFNPFSSATPFNESLVLFLQMGVVGALACVGFFVLVSISDSITRQHWPEKLSSYDYLRQGMIFNKPIGTVLLRSVALAFILAGLYTCLLYLFPGLYIKIESTFVSEKAAWPPFFLLLQNIWFSFSIILALFLAIGSQAYGQLNNKWATVFVIVIASGILVPVFISMGPPYYEFLVGSLFGFILALIYLRWDFLTLLLSHFVFLGLLESATGWIMPNSPDAYIFLCFIGFLIVIVAGGCLAIFMGKEERSLPEYIPGYVEELAQEQRIKQELQIAREVQQSFLPTKMPQIAGLDMAAICQPAYETGGDYYDFIQLDEHRAAIAIGDVSGKGIQAAFYMTFVKGLLHTLCRETDSPAEVLSKANRLFYDNATKGTFVSLIFGILDLEHQTFRFARAGHNPILHMNTSSKKVKELQPEGLGLGLTKDKIFDNKIREIELSITEHDLFLLYTDGIVEALNEAHQFYGTEKLIKLIKKQKDKPAKIIISDVLQGITTYIGKAKQHDDMTLMAIRFNKNQR